MSDNEPVDSGSALQPYLDRIAAAHLGVKPYKSESDITLELFPRNGEGTALESLLRNGERVVITKLKFKSLQDFFSWENDGFLPSCSPLTKSFLQSLRGIEINDVSGESFLPMSLYLTSSEVLSLNGLVPIISNEVLLERQSTNFASIFTTQLDKHPSGFQLGCLIQADLDCLSVLSTTNLELETLVYLVLPFLGE